MPRMALPARVMPNARSKNLAAASGSGTERAICRSFAMGGLLAEGTRSMGLHGCFRFALRLLGRGGRGLPRQIFGDDRAIELGNCAVRKPTPDLVHAEEGYAQIASQCQPLAIRAYGHHGAVYLSVAGIDDVSALVMQALSLHASDQ